MWAPVSTGRSPTCSIVIPAFNRGRYLVNALTSLAEQERDPNDFEVVLVNDGSTDDTHELCRALRLPYHLEYIEKPNRDCRAETRNVGVRAARGDVVVFLDAEMLCPPGFVDAHLDLHERFGPCVVAGWDRRITLPPGERLPRDWLDQARRLRGGRGCFPGLNTARHLRPLVTSNSSCRRVDALEVGLFDEAYRGYGHEDLDLGMRLHLLGRRFISDPATVAYHQAHSVSPRVGSDAARNSRYYYRKHHRRRHVLHFLDALSCGGAERHIVSLAQNLHGRQHMFTVVTAGRSYHFVDELAELGVPIHRVSFDQLDRFLAGRPVDLIHVHYAPTQWLRHLLRAHTSAPMVATIHSEVPLDPDPRLKLLICVSQNVLNHQPRQRGPYRVIRPGTDPRAFAPRGRREAARRQLGLPPDAFVVGTAARLDFTKLSARMLHVYAQLVRLRRNLHVAIFGTGPDLQRSRKHIQRTGLSDRLHLFDPVRNVSAGLEALDVCVHAVEGEPFGLAVLEALAKGLPVVAPNAGGLRETVEDGVCGFLCCNARELIQRVLELADGRHDLEQMRQSAMARAHLFDQRRTALKHRLVYDEAIEGARYWWPRVQPETSRRHSSTSSAKCGA